MEKIITLSANSEKEAIDKAFESTGIDSSSGEAVIISEKKHGIFGLGGKTFEIKVAINEHDVAHILKEYVENLIERLGFSGADIVISQLEDSIEISINGDDLGLLIGKHGETIKALNIICTAYLTHITSSRQYISLDVSDYVKKRHEKIIDIAKSAALRVAESGRSFALKPMPADERRVVHIALKEEEDVLTASEGDEPFRQVLIIPKHKG